MAHAASAYYLSPWDLSEEVLIFTADAAGDGLSSTVNLGRKGRIERLKNSESLYYDSLGYCFYDEITYFLGMRPNDHAYKVMGLAPYGDPNKCIDKIKTMIDIDKQNNSILYLTLIILEAYELSSKLIRYSEIDSMLWINYIGLEPIIKYNEIT